MLSDLSGVMIGADGYYRQTAQDGMPNVEQQTASAGADVARAFGPFSFQGEGFVRWQRTEPLGGGLVQTYEAAVSGDLAAGGQHLELVLAYRCADAGAPAFTHRVATQAQLTL